MRYGQFGDSPIGIVRNLLRDPGLFIDWLARADVLHYLRDLGASSGGLAILYPFGLALALPSMAINLFSASDWMRSGGGHYSAIIVPFLVIASIYGVAWHVRNRRPLGSRSLPAPRRNGFSRSASRVSSLALVTVGLGVALVHHHQAGLSPLSRRFSWEPIGEHARRARPLIDRVNDLPPDVPISAGSNLYPHVAHRESVYLFPTISDAEFILLDVTGSAAPVGPGDQRQLVREMLDHAAFGVAESDHGLLLLERGLDAYRISPGFYEAFLAGEARPERHWRRLWSHAKSRRCPGAAPGGFRLGRATRRPPRTRGRDHHLLAGTGHPWRRSIAWSFTSGMRTADGPHPAGGAGPALVPDLVLGTGHTGHK